MEDPKLPNIANEKVPQQNDTQLEILKQLKRQNDLLEEQLVLQKEQKRKEEIIQQQRKDQAVRHILQNHLPHSSKKKPAYEIPITLSYKTCVFMNTCFGKIENFNNVKKYVNYYVYEQKLLNAEKQLIPDKQLSDFLGVEPGKILSYDIFLYKLEYAI
jgi:hypothetical protein